LQVEKMMSDKKNAEVSVISPLSKWREIFARRRGALWRVLLLLAALCGLGAANAHAGSSAKMLKVTTKDVGGITHFYVQNLEAADVTATFDMKLKNLQCSTNLPFTTTFPGNRTVEAFTLAPVEPGAPWSFSYTDAFTIGSVNAIHDDSVVYALPYGVGKSFRVTQGYHGSFSHTGPDEFAIDWKMPIGTPVHAARGGVVVKAKDDSSVGGPERKYEDCANCVLIEHTDGTIGIYAHLMKNGCQVKVGDTVKTGDLIAMSGNTGFTSGPHLHFSVFKTRSGKERQSLPVRFRTADGVAMELATSQSYKSIPIEVRVAKVSAAQAATATP
jgi:murein DD-endopeptidase MepM/ murein hydrolase activator NlpD